jgi:hypothetical protein
MEIKSQGLPAISINGENIMMPKDVKIVLSSADGKEIYMHDFISRPLARQIENLLEDNNLGTRKIPTRELI